MSIKYTKHETSFPKSDKLCILQENLNMQRFYINKNMVPQSNKVYNIPDIKNNLGGQTKI